LFLDASRVYSIRQLNERGRVGERLIDMTSTTDQAPAAPNFLITEYEAMQARLKFLREDLIRSETIAPLACAAIYSWSLTNEALTHAGLTVILILPVLISVVVFLRQVSRYNSVKQLERYIKEELEPRLHPATGPVGYENYIRSGGRPLGFPYLYVSRYILWISMLVGSLFLSVAVAADLLPLAAKPKVAAAAPCPVSPTPKHSASTVPTQTTIKKVP